MAFPSSSSFHSCHGTSTSTSATSSYFPSSQTTSHRHRHRHRHRHHHHTTKTHLLSSSISASKPLQPFLLSLSLPNPPLHFTSLRKTSNHSFITVKTRVSDADNQLDTRSSPSSEIDCVGTGTDVECVVPSDGKGDYGVTESETVSLINVVMEWTLLVSPFFFWGTAMVAMKEVLPKTGPLFVSSFRLIPSGLLLVAFAASRGRKIPSGLNAWLSIALFAVVDATCFQGFLAKGLEKTAAGLGSVIIDSQPLTVAVLASLIYGESIGLVGIAGLVLGVVGLLLLEHMVLGGIPLAALSILAHDPAVNGGLNELTTNDLFALLYTSVFGSAISYGLYFFNATRGSLTKLSSLTFLTPIFLYLGETFSPIQLTGAIVTVAAIYMLSSLPAYSYLEETSTKTTLSTDSNRLAEFGSTEGDFRLKRWLLAKLLLSEDSCSSVVAEPPLLTVM
ncbi:Drug/metabolite transporter [Cynara cardunculus var. scolymus]|uniref:Drug/metabolite transporter n=1 Tax=Cynara cardunculus var. scolymus TaxID=59895 RepID=A0A118JUU6_CYNCS|nr:Drug/metabolite transporter [Cynara cardunculus var. scolymus]